MPKKAPSVAMQDIQSQNRQEVGHICLINKTNTNEKEKIPTWNRNQSCGMYQSQLSNTQGNIKEAAKHPSSSLVSNIQF